MHGQQNIKTYTAFRVQKDVWHLSFVGPSTTSRQQHKLRHAQSSALRAKLNTHNTTCCHIASFNIGISDVLLIKVILARN